MYKNIKGNVETGKILKILILLQAAQEERRKGKSFIKIVSQNDGMTKEHEMQSPSIKKRQQ